MKFRKDNGKRYVMTIHYTEPGKFLGVELSSVEREFVIHNVTERQLKKAKRLFLKTHGIPYQRVAMNNQKGTFIVIRGDQLKSLEYHEVVE